MGALPVCTGVSFRVWVGFYSHGWWDSKTHKSHESMVYVMAIGWILERQLTSKALPAHLGYPHGIKA